MLAQYSRVIRPDDEPAASTEPTAEAAPARKRGPVRIRKLDA
jgi:hypothetical protein